MSRSNNQEDKIMSDFKLWHNKCHYCDCEDCVIHNKTFPTECDINCQFCEGGEGGSIIGCKKYKEVRKCQESE